MPDKQKPVETAATILLWMGVVYYAVGAVVSIAVIGLLVLLVTAA